MSTNRAELSRRIRNLRAKIERKRRLRDRWAEDPEYGVLCTIPTESVIFLDREIRLMEKYLTRLQMCRAKMPKRG